MKNKEIYWLFWPNIYKNSWIWKYSSLYVEKLKKEINIKEFSTNFFPKGVLRILWSFLYIPIYLIFFPNKIKVFYEEWWLPILIFPMKNSIFIIHDIRDFDLTTNNPSYFLKFYFNLLKKSFIKLNSNKVVKIICPSIFTKNKLIDLWINEKKIEVIYNPIDENYEILNIDKKELKKRIFIKYNIDLSNLDKNIILNIWTEEDRKNIMTILKTLKLLKNYIFIKIWDPIIEDNRTKHLKYIYRNNINSIFLNNLELKDIINFYNIWDIYLNTSVFEWFWRTVVEAQACWCPVLSTYNSWLKEVLWNIQIRINDWLDENEILSKINLILNNIEKKEYLVKFWLENSKRFLIEKNLWNWNNILK